MRQLLRITTTLALGLILTAGMAFGQDVNSQTTVDQDGGQNTAEVEHQGDNNESTINQVGNNNTAKALGVFSKDRGSGLTASSVTFQDQEGDKNSAILKVDRTLRTTGNKMEATQIQDGNLNEIRAEGVGLGTTINQQQHGSRNDAFLVDGSFDGTNVASSELNQYQDGFSNNARIFVGSDLAQNADIDQLQVGNNNRSVIRNFDSYAIGKDGASRVDVVQRRNGHTADADFAGGAQIFDVTQKAGNGNTATADFTSDTGMVNSFTATQVGSGNTATYNQSN